MRPTGFGVSRCVVVNIDHGGQAAHMGVARNMVMASIGGEDGRACTLAMR